MTWALHSAGTYLEIFLAKEIVVANEPLRLVLRLPETRPLDHPRRRDRPI